MAWLRFIADMDWKPSAVITIEYKARMVQNVTRDCADKAVAAGKGIRLKTPRNGEVAELTSLSEPSALPLPVPA